MGISLIKVRNTLIVLDVIEQKEKKVGDITVPANNDLYAEAEVMAVGPGLSLTMNDRTETSDLKVGQRVLVKHKQQQKPPPYPPELAGIRYQEGTKFYYIFDQTSIVGIIAEPGTFPTTPLLKIAN